MSPHLSKSFILFKRHIDKVTELVIHVDSQKDGGREFEGLLPCAEIRIDEWADVSRIVNADVIQVAHTGNSNTMEDSNYGHWV